MLNCSASFMMSTSVFKALPGKLYINRRSPIILPAKSRSDVCFVYKVMGLTFHDRINTQLIYRFDYLAQVVASRITKPQQFLLGSNLTGSSFFIQFSFNFLGWGGLILLFSLCLIFFLFLFLFISFFYFLTLAKWQNHSAVY